MIADILIHVIGDGKGAGVAFGLSVAKAFNAHATGLIVGLDPMVTVGYFGGMPADIMAANRRATEEAVAATAARFEREAKAAGVSAEIIRLIVPLDVSVDSYVREVRLFDLSVVTQPEPEGLGASGAALEAGLFESGRSVLVVPYVQKAPLKLDRVIVAWDGGRPATRAVAEAMPFLARAGQVQVLTVATKRPDPNELPGAGLARHLARHKLKVELRNVVAPGEDVDSTILNEVADSGADLIVMGGYGHSRFRQFLLGGVTRGIIRSMTAPVLMAH